MKSHNEEEYFARLEIDKKRKFSEETRQKLAEEEKARLKALHENRCAKCGNELHEVVFKGVMIDKCFNCGAVVLNNGELEKLAGEEDSIISAVIGLFK